MDSDEGYNYEFDEDEECSEDSGAEEDEEDDDEDEPDDNLDLGEVELVEPGLRVGGERDGLLGSETGGLGPGGGGGGGGLGGGPGPGGGGGPEQEEDYRYEVLTAEQILQHMVECIREVNEVIQNPATITRILLSHFNWDKEKLMERYFDGNLEKLFAECHVINPSKKSRTRQMNTRSSAQDMPCQICYLNYPNSYFTGLECGHKFCMQCWSEYLTTKIMEEGMGQTISCPAHGCDILVDDNTVMRLITDSKVKLKYQHLITNSFVECNRLLKWCPAPDCHHVVKVQYPDAKPVRCKCGRQFCFNCGENWHDPVKCKWLKKWIKKCDDDSETSNWIAANTKQENRAVVFGEGCLVPSQLFASVTASQSPNSVLNFFILKNLEGNRIRYHQMQKSLFSVGKTLQECPKCHVTIEKDGGCNHMVCRNQNCKAEFCWVCLGPWEPHGSAWYNCNRYNEDDAKAARDAQERSRAALQRYLFYCNRYMNHMQSLRFEHKLYAQVKQKMEEMQQHNMSWIEVQFLKKAVDVLCQCRATLMYTYVFAFYLKKNNQSIIFENNQADLENATEVLSGYLERDISQDSLQDIKQKVQDKYRYCESRRRVLLQHVHEGYEKDLWEYIED
ncbi:E3 ubiquitin-protein ligase ARIH1 isoform X3 [Falco naumanni]|uniref:E3 ubiquitin-protein ligase ARIH1 isoform X3 n=1 Tax=Falco naumanni TaxID=148594 RepID=UPI001ADE3A13|nr:E3 ubiquitin-protein ligase ARIH1 isoform X3 [Falco naumanni]